MSRHPGKSSPSRGGADTFENSGSLPPVEEENTCYSDVSFMGRETAGFALRLRGGESRKMSTTMANTFLPDIGQRGDDNDETDSQASETDALEAEKRAFQRSMNLNPEQIAKMLESYDGCPEDHPGCFEIEERAPGQEGQYQKVKAELESLEAQADEERKRVQGIQSNKEILISRTENAEDNILELQTTLRRNKDGKIQSEIEIETHREGVKKMETEIRNLNELIAAQELAFSQMHRSLDEGGGLVSPIKSHPANSEDASAVRSLRHDMDIWANRPSRHPVGNKAPSPGGLSPGT